MDIPTPEEIAALLQARETPHKDSLRAKILQELETRGRAHITPNANEYEVAKYVAEEFRAKGWKVLFGTDQKDGPWVIVEAK